MSNALEDIDKALVLLRDARDKMVGHALLSQQLQTVVAQSYRGIAETAQVLRTAAQALNAVKHERELLFQQFPGDE